VIRCPNCGEANDLGSRFCFNCGASLAALQPEPAPTPPPEAERPPDPSWQPAPLEEAQPAAPEEAPPPPERPQPSIPPQYAPPASWSGGQPAWGSPGQAGQPTRSGWAAIDELDPPPPPKRRATWLLVILGIIGGCLLVCVGTFIFMLTPPGEDTFEELSTVFAELATEQAPEPTRVP
jgi:hypothetical protein